MQKRQVLIIHGGDVFETREAYLASLRERNVDLAYFSGRDWKAVLEQALGEDYTVIMPRMPNKQNARYDEWKIWFEKILPLLDDEIILIGHSLGGTFLTRYLSEEPIGKTILATFLVAAPLMEEYSRKDYLGDFLPPGDLRPFAERAGTIFLYFSRDDRVVPFANMQRYKEALPGSKAREFSDRGHFNQESFPEIVTDIKSVD